MSDYGQSLKRATALKRAGDIQGAVQAIDEALAQALPGTAARPSAWKKRIFYLLHAGHGDAAMASAERLINEAEREADGDAALVGTAYSFAFQERARVYNAIGDPRSALTDFLRASWHWQQAMVLQGRAESEFPPDRVAESLLEAVEACGYESDLSTLEELIQKHIGSPDVELFVSQGLTALAHERIANFKHGLTDR